MNSDNQSGNNAGDSDNDVLSHEIKAALGQLRQASFSDGFEDRAWLRWQRERKAASNIFVMIERRALQLLPVAIAASMILAVYSSRHHRTSQVSNASFIARTLGWNGATTTSASAAAAPTYESVYAQLYGLPELNSTPGVR